MSSPAPSGDSGAVSGWRFLVDENQPPILLGRLQTAGYFAEDVRDVGLGAHPDRDIWRYAQEHDETVVRDGGHRR